MARLSRRWLTQVCTPRDHFFSHTLSLSDWFGQGTKSDAYGLTSSAARWEAFMRACEQAAPLVMAQDGLRVEPRVGYDPRGDQPFFVFKASNNGTTVLVSPNGLAMDSDDAKTVRFGGEDEMLDELVDEVISDYANELIDRDTVVNSRMAETNATGFHVDSVEVAHAQFDSLNPPRVQFEAEAHYAGEQMVDRMFAGDRVTARLQGYLVFDDGEWRVEDACHVEAEVDPLDD